MWSLVSRGLASADSRCTRRAERTGRIPQATHQSTRSPSPWWRDCAWRDCALMPSARAEGEFLARRRGRSR
eukprot:scaffold82733_cov90-Phaeocystis_antarctica.AAC.1